MGKNISVQDLISIIIPVYNAEKHLDKCIQSVLAQTYTNWELLLIDDGSTDSSGVICDKYAEQDSRIKVFHKENGGVSSARNLGLDNAKGEWITFVDSDDWVDTKYLRLLLGNNDSDLMVCAFIAEGRMNWEDTLDDEKYSSRDEIRHFIDKNLIGASLSAPWCKFFKSEIIRTQHLKFDKKIHLGEDTLFVINYLSYTSSITTISQKLYHYNLIGGDGLSAKIERFDQYFYAMDALEAGLSRLRKVFGYDYTAAYLRFELNYFVKQVLSLRKYGFCYNDLIIILTNRHSSAILNDRHILSKGKRRKVFDVLATAHLYSVIAILMKLFRLYY